MPRLLRILYALLLTALPLHAQFGEDDTDIRSQASLLVDHDTIAPGSTFTAALHLYHPEGWHSYYRNSGGVELSPEIEWTLPEGFRAGPIQWPVPQIKEGEFGTSFIYPGQVTLLVDISAPQSLEPGSSITLKAAATWQICEISCKNEDGQFEISLPVSETATLSAGSEELFRQARGKLPGSSEQWNFTAKEEKNGVLLRFRDAGTFEQLPSDFIPDQPYWHPASKGGSVERDGDAILIRLQRATEGPFGNAIEQGNQLSGIVIGAGQTALSPPIDLGATAASPAADESANRTRTAVNFSKLLKILGGMFLGGLILNLMPCVFPVIGLKIMGFVQQAGEDRRKIMLHGITFTLGVLASFAVLSSAIFFAKSATGWGFQLEEPWVVMPLMVLMFVFALNMYGVFEIGVSATSIGGNLQSKQGLSGSFLSGILATIVATPCSAPFLGTAIGAAINLPATQFFSSFFAMALGLSTPYLVLSIYPKLIDSLPRPGAWMVAFKQAMSFLLFATTGYLLWVYAAQIELEHMLKPIFGLSAIAVAAWIYGRWNLPHHIPLTRLISVVLALAFAGGGLYLLKPPALPDASDQHLVLEWQKWTPEKEQQLLAEGKPVYIDFTAKWCVTCQVNKGRAYNQEVIALMQEKGVVALKGDKTRSNPDVDQAIRRYGRVAIPVNVLLAPGKEPIILPELLGPGDVLEALGKIEGK